jgi:hypothetical protein
MLVFARTNQQTFIFIFIYNQKQTRCSEKQQHCPLLFQKLQNTRTELEMIPPYNMEKYIKYILFYFLPKQSSFFLIYLFFTIFIFINKV